MIVMWICQRALRRAAVVLALLLVAGCGANGADAGSDTGGEGAGGPLTVAAFYPLAFVAQRVGAGQVEVGQLTSPGVEPHDLEPSPRQVVAVSEADVLLVQSGFQPAVDDVVAQGAQGSVIDVATVVDLAPAANGEGIDPHFWLDPLRMATLSGAVAEAYAGTDPKNAAKYRSAAAELTGQLERLDRQLSAGLADCQTRTVVTSHDAFGYLADRYDLELLPIAGIDPSNEPSPQRLAELADLVDAEDVTTVFTETLVSPAVAETLAAETGLQVATLDPIEGLSDETSDEDYLTLMQDNLKALIEANRC